MRVLGADAQTRQGDAMGREATPHSWGQAGPGCIFFPRARRSGPHPCDIGRNERKKKEKSSEFDLIIFIKSERNLNKNFEDFTSLEI